MHFIGSPVHSETVSSGGKQVKRGECMIIRYARDIQLARYDFYGYSMKYSEFEQRRS